MLLHTLDPMLATNKIHHDSLYSCLSCIDDTSEESSLPLLRDWIINFEVSLQSIKTVLRYLHQQRVLADFAFVTLPCFSTSGLNIFISPFRAHF